ncbi:MAG: DUF2183 domain-containing protein [Candidatus Pseudobacter hemicellulosilyticus]|uniref:DUF2183 domain-containing protein n=1 Tax=Candidatus Pseudobacter hemicellulosilyticus TaxID=3121375 RepID=A0AAJ5WQH8_9BACT|nr:MAG: DUF2183 domain-containing protein [Pseudobacter sp.]
MKKLKEIVFRWMRLSNRPVVKLYHGFGGNGQLVIYGHVLAISPLPRKKYRQNVWTNTLALIRLFMVKPIAGVEVLLNYEGAAVRATTDTDGFFRLQWKPAQMPAPGWHTVEVVIENGPSASLKGISGEGELLAPDPGQYAIISDIDDTFLISHSSNLRKRLFVLLTQNAYSRQPFEDVVRHYQALAKAGSVNGGSNPFFYVSSSEWNLYNYILDFTRKNELPKGVFLLSQLKRLSEAWKTGQNKHATKFTRIVRILEAFPDQQFILLGDDSQQDPVIYASVAEHFGTRIRAVYLRNVFPKNKAMVDTAIAGITAAGIPVCHFTHSREAIAHSAAIGLISPEQPLP